MKGFTLPFGGFQIHLAGSSVAESAPPLQKALRDHDALLDKAYADNPSLSPIEALSYYAEEFSASIETIEIASRQFQQSLKNAEFPDVFPDCTKQLIFASIVAQAFQLVFEVIDYECMMENKASYYWWLTGRIVDKRGNVNKCPGKSFIFDKSNDEIAEGALLSACADAFIHCVFSAVPHFPWDRWNIVSIE